MRFSCTPWPTTGPAEGAHLSTPLDPELWARLEPLLDRVLELPEEERAAFVAHACAGDEALRAHLEALLRADAAKGEFLDGGLGDVPLSLLALGEENPPPVPERIGPYRIVQEAGRGGMGTVYLAERDDGQFRKRVALKVIREEAATPYLVRRFMEERRILAALEHPGVALLLDGGLTSAGAPYYAMEFVDGVRIDRWCDHRNLSVRRRLDVYLQVCDAVAYAHRNLVVHRDLKPANILVTAEERVKLLDFGVARLLEPERGHQATVPGLRLLTPEYASPEQLQGEAVTTASDIFSLGVLLHELLTGRTPEREPTGGSGGQERGAGGVLQEDPSTVAARSHEEGLPRLGGTNPRALARQLRGDLDAILRKALAPDPAGRYGTVEALADDLRRHLQGLPVAARRGSTAYVVRRFIRRRRLPLAAAAGLALAMAVMGAAHTRAVGMERDLALAEAARADQVSRFLVDLFAQSDPLGDRTGVTDVREFLAVGTDRIRGELADQPELRASLLRALGRVHDNLSNYDEADALFQEALALRRIHLPPGHDEVAEVLQDLGALRRRQGADAAADTFLAEALRIRSDPRRYPRRVETLEELAGLRLAGSRLDEADALFRQVLEMRRAEEPQDARGISDALTGLGVIARQAGELDRAEALHREALQLRREVHGPEHLYVAESMKNLALTLQSAGRYAEAREGYEEALAMQLREVGEEHALPSSTRNSLGALLRTLGDLEGAEEHYRVVLDVQRTLVGDRHPRVALAMTNLALVHWDRQDFGAAEVMAREALETRRQVLAPDHPAVAQGLNVLGVILRSAGRFDEAEDLLRQAEVIYLERFGPDHSAVAINRTALALARLQRGAFVEAEELFRSVLDIHHRDGREGHPESVRALLGLARALRGQGRAAEATEPLANALRVQRQHFPEDHPDLEEILAEMALLDGSEAGT